MNNFALIVPIVFFAIFCIGNGFLIGWMAFSGGITKEEAFENNGAQYNPINDNF